MTDLNEILPPDLEGRDSIIEKFGGEDGISKLAKSYMEIEQFRGRSVAVPEEDDAEQWGKVMQRLGAPADPSGYKLPEGGDPNLWSGLVEDAASAQLTQRQFDSLAQRTLERNVEESGLADQVREKYGDRYDNALALAKRAAQAEGIEGNWEGNPEMFRLLEKIGAGMTSVNPESDSPAPKANAKVIAQKLREVMGSPAYNDSFHAEHENALALEDQLRTQLREAGYESVHHRDLLSPYSQLHGFTGASVPWDNSDDPNSI